MNENAAPAYGLWGLVVLNVAIFTLFAFSYFKPKTKRDWRTFGAFTAFLVALFVEMYGFPLTIYLLSGPLAKVFPEMNLLSHDMGHLLSNALGFQNGHFNPVHITSDILIFGGFILLASSWRVLYASQQDKKLATTGPYAYVRHPQYLAFIVIMTGFLVQWPTLITLAMYPVLVVMYVRLAHREEREVAAELGDAWAAYAAKTPRWFPRLGKDADRGARGRARYAGGRS